MVSAHLDGDRVVVEITPERRPRLYRDQFALYDLAEPEHAEPFFADLATRGELFCSRVNLMKMTRNTRLKFRWAHRLSSRSSARRWRTTSAAAGTLPFTALDF
jgi:hypothetical protein